MGGVFALSLLGHLAIGVAVWAIAQGHSEVEAVPGVLSVHLVPERGGPGPAARKAMVSAPTPTVTEAARPPEPEPPPSPQEATEPSPPPAKQAAPIQAPAPPVPEPAPAPKKAVRKATPPPRPSGPSKPVKGSSPPRRQTSPPPKKAPSSAGGPSVPEAKPAGEGAGGAAPRDEAGRAAAGPPMVLDSPFPYPWYLDLIRRRVSAGWLKPSVAGRLQQGTVVYFRVLPDGRLGLVEVERSSGLEIYDLSGLRAVQSVGRLPPLPTGFREDHLGVHFEFIP